jgi:hypothetical protein
MRNPGWLAEQFESHRAETFAGRAGAAQPALLDGVPGLVWAQGGWPRVVFEFCMARGKVVAINMVADVERLDTLDVVMLRRLILR